MSKQPFKSPFASSFKSSVNRGTPCSQAVANIARRQGKTPSAVFTSLHRAGLCGRFKYAGSWIWYPTFTPSSTKKSNGQPELWQSYIDWCLASGQCTPEQLAEHTGSQAKLASFTKKFFGTQFSTTKRTKSSKARRTTSTRSTKSTKGSKTSTARTRSGNYAFPKSQKSRSARKAA